MLSFKEAYYMGKHRSAAWHADGGANDEGHSGSRFREVHKVYINGRHWKTFGSKQEAHKAHQSVQKKYPDKHVATHQSFAEETEPLLEYPSDLAKMKKSDSYKVGDKIYTKVGGKWHKGHITTPLNKAGNHGVKFQHNGQTHHYVSSPSELRLHVEEENIQELSSDLLQRYKDEAMKSVDKLNSKGKHKEANDRLLAHMKATGKQIEKTTAEIRKAVGK